MVVMVAAFSTCELDAFVTFKDFSGEIPGTVHRKALDAHAADINVGAVLILRNVSIFNASRTSHYLNVTLDNIVRIFSPDAVPDGKGLGRHIRQPSLPHASAQDHQVFSSRESTTHEESTVGRKVVSASILPTTAPRFQPLDSASTVASSHANLLEATQSSTKLQFDEAVTKSSCPTDVDFLLSGLDESDLDFAPPQM